MDLNHLDALIQKLRVDHPKKWEQYFEMKTLESDNNNESQINYDELNTKHLNKNDIK